MNYLCLLCACVGVVYDSNISVFVSFGLKTIWAWLVVINQEENKNKKGGKEGKRVRLESKHACWGDIKMHIRRHLENTHTQKKCIPKLFLSVDNFHCNIFMTWFDCYFLRRKPETNWTVHPVMEGNQITRLCLCPHTFCFRQRNVMVCETFKHTGNMSTLFVPLCHISWCKSNKWIQFKV